MSELPATERDIAELFAAWGLEADRIPRGEQARLLVDLVSVYARLGLFSASDPQPLCRICANRDACWARLSHTRRESGGPDGSLCLPWIGPRYTPGGVAIVALNMNISPEDNTDPIYEYWISYEQHIHWLAAGYQKNDGSRFAFGAHRSAAALLDAQAGRPVVDRLPEQLPDAVLSTARLQAVKCLPKRASSKPSSAMRQLCVPMVLIDELDVVRPGTVLVLGAVAYEGVARLDAFRAVPCRSRRGLRRGTLCRREWQADVYKVVHPSDPGGRAAPSELALIQHLRRVSTGRQRRVAPSTED